MEERSRSDSKTKHQGNETLKLASEMVDLGKVNGGNTDQSWTSVGDDGRWWCTSCFENKSDRPASDVVPKMGGAGNKRHEVCSRPGFWRFPQKGYLRNVRIMEIMARVRGPIKRTEGAMLKKRQQKRETTDLQ